MTYLPLFFATTIAGSMLCILALAATALRWTRVEVPLVATAITFSILGYVAIIVGAFAKVWGLLG